jgi:hypothetical protein
VEPDEVGLLDLLAYVLPDVVIEVAGGPPQLVGHAPRL